MTQQYVVGDKVRILGLSIFDANEIGATGIVTDGNRELCIGGFGAVVKLPNGRKRVYKYENIEKVAEQMTKKFNVGDMVRIVPTKGQPLRGFIDGDIVTVTSIRFCEKRGEYRYTVEKNGGEQQGFGCNATFELVNAKPTQDKPKKKARLAVAERAISALEAQVAELTAKVEALEKAGKPTTVKAVMDEIAQSIEKAHATPTPKSPNEKRKAIIAEAKAFEGSLPRTANGRYLDCGKYDCTVEYIVNSEKRTVVALLKGMTSGIIRYKGVAKCAPDDVFNADIGKAIALGRALGLDVKRFEQAVKPTEHVNGMLIAPSETAHIGSDKVMRLANRVGRDTDGVWRCHVDSGYDIGSTIIDDTDAQY